MEKITKVKVVAALTVLILFLNVLSPFGIFIPKSQAATTIPTPAVVLRKSSNIQTNGSGVKYFTAQLAFVGDYIPKSYEVRLKYDKDKIVPANKNTQADAALLSLAITQDGLDYGFTTTMGSTTSYLDKTAGTVSFVAYGGSISPTDLGPDNGYDGYLPLYTITFKLLDNTMTEDDITTDLLQLFPYITVPTGYQVIYLDGGNKSFTDPSYFKFDGFKQAVKKVKSIAVQDVPTKTTYDHGDTVSLTGGNLQVTYTDNSTGTVSMTESGVTLKSGTPANVNSPEVQVEYQGYTTEFPITVNDPIASIHVSTSPAKEEYTQNETVDLAGGVVTATTKSGANSTVNLPNAEVTSNVSIADLTAGEVTITGTTPEGLPRGIQRITLIYFGKSAKFDIIVNDTVASIATSNPKTDYRYGEEIDKSQGDIKVTTTSGKTITVPISNGSVSVTGYNPNQLGSQTVTASYLGKSTTYQVNVTDYVDSIEVKVPTKIKYNYGEELVLTGGTVTEVYKSGVKGTTVNLTSSMISGYNKNLSGPQTLTVTYNGKKATFGVTVVDVLKELRVTGMKTSYTYGQALDLTGAKIQQVMESGTVLPAETLTSDMVKTTFNPNQVGKQTLTIEYLGKQTTVEVNVSDLLTGITVKESDKPQESYHYGTTVNKNKGTLVATYISGDSKDIALSNSGVKLQEENGGTFTTSGVTFPVGSTTVEKNMKISYTENSVEKTAIFPVTIVNDLKSIAVQGTPKTQYNIGEAFQNDLSILLTRAQGTPEAMDVTADMVTGFNTTTEGTREVTITYTENGATKTTNYNYTVTDMVTNVVLKTGPTKTEYSYGESLDLTGATIEVTKGSGKTTIPVTESMVGAFDPNQLGEQPLTVSYEGKTATDKIILNVSDKVTGITVTPPTKTNYQKGESLDLSGGSITKIMASGNPGESTAITQEMLTTSFDSNTPGVQEIKLSYAGFTGKFTVTVDDYITGIEMIETPKDRYGYGEALGNPGGKIRVTYKSGTTKEEAITPEMVTEEDGTDFNSKVTFPIDETKVDKNLKVTYEGQSVTYGISIVNTLQTVEMQGTPKKEYNVNDTFQNDLSILINRLTGTPEAIDVTSDMVTGFNTTTEGTKTVTITYSENGVSKTISYDIQVNNPVTGMELQGTPKTNYEVGDEIDVSGLTILLHRPGGDETIVVTTDMVEGYDPQIVGNQTVTIKCNGQTVATYEVTVDNPITGLNWITKPKTSYVIGETLEVTGGKLEATKKNLETEEIDLTEEMITAGFDTSTEGTKIVIVTYEGQTLTYEINVADQVSSIQIVSDPKKDYLYGEELVAGGQLEITKLSGETKTITITPDMISGYHPNQLGSQTLTIDYGGKTITFEVTVSDFLKEVVITPPSKIEYDYNEELDLSDATITKIMASSPEEPETLPVKASMISGYNKTKTGSQTVTITYQEGGKTYTQDFGVTVTDTVKSVTIDTTGVKTEYLYEENLVLDKANIIVTYQSGKVDTIPVNTGMVTGYDSKTLGTQTVEVIYLGVTNSFQVQVKDYVKDISLETPTKVEYRIGEVLSLSGGAIAEIMASGNAGNTVILTQSMVSGFDSTSPGTKQVTVTYTKAGKTFTKQFQVVVVNEINRIEVIPPTKVDYKYGESLDLSGGTIRIIKDDGTSEAVGIRSDMISGYDKTKPGQQIITVTYTDEEGTKLTGNFVVNVGEDYIVNTKFTAPTKKTYQIGEELNLTGGKITEIYASGKTGLVTEITADMVSGYDPYQAGSQTVTVSYGAKEYTYTVRVEDGIKGISIKTYPDKLEYNLGELLSVQGGTINVVKENSITEVPITLDMVSGYQADKAGLQVIRVTYQGYTAEYMVVVNKSESSNPPNTTESTTTIINNNHTSNSTTRVNRTVQTITKPVVKEEPSKDEEAKQEEPKQEEKKEEQVPPIIGNTDNTPTPPSNWVGWRAIITGLIMLGTIALIIVLIAKYKKNVRIYIEEGNERVLVGKERIDKDNRSLNLNKYYKQYQEDTYKVVLSKDISKKLDQKKVDLVVHNKKKSFVVHYDDKECTYRT